MTDNVATTSYAVDPRDLTLLTKNARRMPQRQFAQLVDNLKRDGTLTSVPLVHRSDGGKLVVLSGNHRVKASVAAGFKSITVMEVTGENLTAERLLAIQLSHNAITGEDDQNILAELYDSLGVMEKLYSGLTDADFGGVAELDLTKLTIAAPQYEEVTLMFLPEDHEVFKGAMEKIAKRSAKSSRFVGRLADFEQFEAALVAVQETLNIHNQALAILTMSELALERLDQMKGEQGGRSTTTTAGEADEDAGAERAAQLGGDHVGGSAEAAG